MLLSLGGKVKDEHISVLINAGLLVSELGILIHIRCYSSPLSIFVDPQNDSNLFVTMMTYWSESEKQAAYNGFS